MSRRQLKLRAKAQIRGNVFILFLIEMISNIDLWIHAIVGSTGIIGSMFAIIIGAGLSGSVDISVSQQFNKLSGAFAGYGIAFLILHYVIGSPLAISLSRTYLDLSEEKKPKFARLGYGFKTCWEQSVLLQILKSVFIFLWSLLFIIPGIIKNYSYSMANYIMAENPDIDALEAITKSKNMMRGNKFSLFILHISFFFWYLLIPITLGLALIYIKPYVQAANMNFYLNIKNSEEEEELKEA